MVQSRAGHHAASTTTSHQKIAKSTKTFKPSKSSVDVIKSKDSKNSTNLTAALLETTENGATKACKVERKEPEPVINAVETSRKQRTEKILAKRKQAEDEKERFAKEAAERRAAEREEIIKQAKRLILYRKPMCRRINRALLVSECLRELDAQVKFQGTIKNIDKEEEITYVNLMKADVAKYEEEKKQKAEEEVEKRKKYADELKKQIEENVKDTKNKQMEEFEVEKQDQINTNKYLQDMKEYEAEQLLNKKQKLKQFFQDAIEEKKQIHLKLKHEEQFEDRAIEIYRKAKTRILKMHKQTALKEKEEKKRRAQITADKFCTTIQPRDELEDKILKKALGEQEARKSEKERLRKDNENQRRKELQDFEAEARAAKSKQLQEDNHFKAWEMMQRFKKTEFDKKLEIEERKRERNKKIEYASALQKHISEKENERKQEKYYEEKITNTKQIIEKENQRVLNYAEEVLNESSGIRPLYPILKAVEQCKKEMGLTPLKKEETKEVIDQGRKRSRRITRSCTKFVPDDKICYL